MADRDLMQLALPGSGGASIAGAAAGAAARLAGLDAVAAEHLGEVCRAVCEIVEETAFDDPRDARVEVHVRRHAHDIVVEIDDHGMPFNQAGVAAVDARVVRAALQLGWIDEFDHFTRGRDGNRSMLVVHLDPGPDVRDAPGTGAAATPDTTTAERVDEETAAAIVHRQATGADAEALARLTWRTYGYSYQRDEYYHPAQLADILDAVDNQGWVAVTPDGEAVAHLAVGVERADALVAEGGRGMVDPRYRRHGVLRLLGAPMVGWMADRGLIGLYGHAVTAHTGTQGGEDNTIFGLALGYLPPVITFKDLAAPTSDQRQSVAMTYTALAEQPRRIVHAPDVDAAIIEEMFGRSGLEREVRSVSSFDATMDDADPDDPPHVDVILRRDLGIARIIVTRPTTALYEVVRDEVPLLLANGAEVLHVELPLGQPATPSAAHELSWLGFYFAGVVPYFGTDGSDMLVYQRTGDLAFDPDAIQLASTFSTRVLEHVFARRQASGTQ